MDELVKIISDIKNESSRTGKEAILKQHEDNELFRYVLRFVYNPFIVTGISTKKLNKKMEKKVKEVLAENKHPKTIDELLRYLKTNNTGRDDDVAVVQAFIRRLQGEDTRNIVKQIVTKSLKIGITDKTINKVYGKGDIPSFAVMLAETYEKKESHVKGKFYITQKLDGNRCIAIKDEDEVKFFTRKGQSIDGMNDLIREVMKFPNGTVLDGEILLINDDNLTSDELFRATQKVIRKDGIKKNLEFHVFDKVSLKEFQDGKSINTYEDRRESLEALFSLLDEKLQFTHLLPTLYKGDDKNMIAVLMKFAEEKGWEGLMVNTADGLYQTKRTADLLKVKKFKSADGVVIGVYEGEGKYKGRLGGVLITYKDMAVKVGSGFTDSERDKYWNDQDSIIGKVGQYNYFEESKNQNGGYDLRFATWKGIREDKTANDVNYE